MEPERGPNEAAHPSATRRHRTGAWKLQALSYVLVARKGGDAPSENHSPVKKDVSVQGVVVAKAGMPARDADTSLSREAE